MVRDERQASDGLGKTNPAQRCNIRDTPSLNDTNYEYCSIHVFVCSGLCPYHQVATAAPVVCEYKSLSSSLGLVHKDRLCMIPFI
jgi:hypothetical protein